MNSARRSAWRSPMRRRALLAVNLTPMIDVVFLLLVYFLLVAEFRRNERTIPLRTPAVAEEIATDPFRLPRRPVRITLEPIDETKCAIRTDAPALGAPADFDALRSLAEEARGESLADEQEFVIDAQRGVRWEHAVRAVDALRRAGYSEIIFAAPAEDAG